MCPATSGQPHVGGSIGPRWRNTERALCQWIVLMLHKTGRHHVNDITLRCRCGLGAPSGQFQAAKMVFNLPTHVKKTKPAA